MCIRILWCITHGRFAHSYLVLSRLVTVICKGANFLDKDGSEGSKPDRKGSPLMSTTYVQAANSMLMSRTDCCNQLHLCRFYAAEHALDIWFIDVAYMCS